MFITKKKIKAISILSNLILFYISIGLTKEIPSNNSELSELDIQNNVAQAKITITKIYGYKQEDALHLQELKLGDSFDATIEIWPKDLIPFPQIEDFTSKTILNLFYINNIKNIITSENNPDVIVINANMVLIKNFSDFNYHILKLRDKEISTFIENNVKIIYDTKDKGNITFDDFKYFEINITNPRDLDQTRIIVLISIAILFLLSIIIYFSIIGINFYQNKITYRNSILYWQDLFEKKTLKRDDFELIYAKKTEWIPLVKNYLKHKENIDKFLSNLNLHQYKKNWDQHVYNEVTGTFEGIRHIWSNNLNQVHN